MTDAGRRVEQVYDVAAQARMTVWANAIPELAGNKVATTVRASKPIIAERAVYFWADGGVWRGGHVSAGATAPALGAGSWPRGGRGRSSTPTC